MQTLTVGTRGLRLLARINSDLLLMVGTLFVALSLAAYLATLL